MNFSLFTDGPIGILTDRIRQPGIILFKDYWDKRIAYFLVVMRFFGR